MEKKYYYLSVTRKPKGPHTLAELSGMLVRGDLTTATEVAADGDKCWQPLGVLLMQEQVAVGTLPPVPGSAGTPLPPVPGGIAAPPLPKFGMWQCIKDALRKTFTWQGRATRAQYWYPCLFFILIHIVLIATCLATLCFGLESVLNEVWKDGVDWDKLSNADFFGKPMRPFWCSLVVSGVVWLWLILAQMAVTIRRLHDIGRSAVWVFSYLALSIAWDVYYFYTMITYLASVNWKLLISIEDKESRNARIEEVIDKTDLIGFEGVGGLLYLAFYIFGLVLFVFTVLDSKRGTNKYGTSAKYPQA